MKNIFKLLLSAMLCAVMCVCVCACSCDGKSNTDGKDGPTNPIDDDEWTKLY